MSAFLRSQKQILGLNSHYRTINTTCKNRFVNYRSKKCSFSKYGIFPYNHNHMTTILAASPTAIDVLRYDFDAGAIRFISTNRTLYEQASSKVEVTVQTIKQTQKDKEKEQLADAIKTSTEATPAPTTAIATAPIVKKTLKQKIWAEMVHYYHGFRLLFIDINVSRKLLWRILNGKSLNRREHRLLIRTTSDLFRLVPFSVFIIVPFMELLLPVAIKLFPGMLPSTFTTATEREDKVKQNLKVKLEMAKFLQKTLDDMTLQHKEHRSQAAKDFSEFFTKVRTTGDQANHEEIIKFSKLFEDEITLDSLSRPQLAALCRVIEVSSLGTSNFLRFQLRMKLRSLAADDRSIQKEGVESLTLSELQSACRARGMRAYGISEERLKSQLQEWIYLSLNEKVPPSLLLLSRALMLPENVPTSDKLKATISALPESIAAQTKVAIAEKEGKVDNKTKIEIIKEEERKIKEEREEEKENQQEIMDKQKEIAETLVDNAPIVTSDTILHRETVNIAEPVIVLASEELSSKDMEAIGDALGTLSKDKKTLMVEKEEIRDLKEEIADYQEDVQELQEVVTSIPDRVEVKESRAAKLLYKKVNSMISKMDTVLADLEQKEKQLKQHVEEVEIETSEVVEKKDELVRIDELMLAIRKIKNVPNDSRVEQIQKILGKIDDDHDGSIKVEDVLKVIETIGKENVQLNAKQVDELIDLLDKEEIIEAEEKIEKALSKSLEAKEKLKETKILEEAKEIELKDNLTKIIDANVDDASKSKIDEPLIGADVLQAAADKNKEKLIPSITTDSKIPPNIPTIAVPPPSQTSSTSNSKTKSL